MTEGVHRAVSVRARETEMLTAKGGDLEGALDRAAEAVARAEALVITAGAGIGVDSGLPDFRGTEGFWRAYPQFAKIGLRFEELANPSHFERDPSLAWGFYGHRLQLYRRVEPHRGYGILQSWAAAVSGGAFVFTSNVDGHFQRAGFFADRIVECHGSLLHLQCSRPCTRRVWSAHGVDVTIDGSTFRAERPLPTCPDCGAVARPNVLMFGDWHWLSERTAVQEERFRGWLDEVGDALTILELGAGTAVPTVRLTSEHLARRPGACLVRINPRDSQVPPRAVSLATGALRAIEAIDARLTGKASARG